MQIGHGSISHGQTTSNTGGARQTAGRVEKRKRRQHEAPASCHRQIQGAARSGVAHEAAGENGARCKAKRKERPGRLVDRRILRPVPPSRKVLQLASAEEIQHRQMEVQEQRVSDSRAHGPAAMQDVVHVRLAYTDRQREPSLRPEAIADSAPGEEPQPRSEFSQAEHRSAATPASGIDSTFQEGKGHARNSGTKKATKTESPQSPYVMASGAAMKELNSDLGEVPADSPKRNRTTPE
jgi:hypothetical protein